VDASREQGRFRGWVVRRLYPGDPCHQMVDLRPGDVVVRVNGRSIERDRQAHEIFTELRVAPGLVVEIVRAGTARKITLPIVDE
jgi:type II secretory pathway component PulC